MRSSSLRPRSPSLRARLAGSLLRRLVKPRSLAEPDPLASRAFVNRFVMPMIPGCRIAADRIGAVPVETVTRVSRRDEAAATLLYLHGGAYVVCSPATHRPLTAAFARRGFRVVAPQYRLAPEHRFPAALEDAVSVYRGLLAGGGDPARIGVAGDSAGGGLALALLVRLRDLGLPLPAAAALFSPWTDLALTGGTLRSNAARDILFHPVHAARVARHYLGDADPTDPLVSPLYADPSGLPPLLIHVGDSEILLDDSRRVATRAAAAGVEVVFETWPAVPHGWQIACAVLPEARRSVDVAAAFLRARTAGGRLSRTRERSSQPSG